MLKLDDVKICPFSLEGFKDKKEQDWSKLHYIEKNCRCWNYFGDGLCYSCNNDSNVCPFAAIELKTEKFEILDKVEVTGKGTIIIIRNDIGYPISLKSLVNYKNFFDNIKGIEGMMTLMYPPKPKPQLGLIVSKSFYNFVNIGDKITIISE